MKTLHIPNSDDDTFLQTLLKSKFGVIIKCFYRYVEKDVCLSLEIWSPFIVIFVFFLDAVQYWGAIVWDQ